MNSHYLISRIQLDIITYAIENIISLTTTYTHEELQTITLHLIENIIKEQYIEKSSHSMKTIIKEINERITKD